MTTNPTISKQPDQPNIAQSLATNPRMCPRFEQATQLLGKRWTAMLLEALLQGPQRFCEMTTSVEGLSDRVLSDRLRELETEGIVERIVYPHIPVRVEYQLTDKGRALAPVIGAIHQWAEEWLPLPAMPGPAPESSAEHIELDDCQ
jgi:DNA-binding HxlR family transcriptional regulator